MSETKDYYYMISLGYYKLKNKQNPLSFLCQRGVTKVAEGTTRDDVAEGLQRGVCVENNVDFSSTGVFFFYLEPNAMG